MKKSRLNGLDWQILEFLQQDGRMSVSELSNRLGRSRSSIAERMARLKDAGVLEGFSIRLNEEQLGFGLSAYVRLQADSSHHRRISDFVLGLPEVAECHILAGSDLLLMRIIARDMPHLREVVDRLTKWGATNTDVIFSTLKSEPVADASLRNASDAR